MSAISAANPRPRPLSRLLLLTLAFAGCAILVDKFAPAIFAGHTLVLGIVFYWIALHVLGPRPAVVVLVVSTGVLALKWGQPYSGSMIALEGLWVSFAWRRRFNPLLADLLYWLLVGTPLSWFIYRTVYVIPEPSLSLALMVQPVNGFVACWIAYIVVDQFPRHGSVIGTPTVQSFRRFLFKRYIAFGTFPVLAAGLLVARNFEQSALSEARDNLSTTARHIAAVIGRQVTKGATTVQAVASRQTSSAWFADTTRMTAELDRAQKESGLLIAMLAANAGGTVLARAPSHQLDLAGLPASVGDREYFRAPMETGRPFISDVFRGRRAGRHLLVAVSAPAVSHDGARIGVIEGSITVRVFENLLRLNSSGDTWRAVLCDRHQQIIASDGLDLPPLTRLATTPLGEFISRQTPLPTRLTVDSGTSRVSYLSLSVPVPDTDWTLTVQREWGDVLSPIINGYIWTLGVAFVTVIIASLFATWSIRDLIHAWRNLIDFSRAPSIQLQLLEDSARFDLPQEFRELLHNLEAMARRLVSEQEQRERLLQELEARVIERTRDLGDALVLAQAADRAKSTFLATVSHELRTPLTSIITGITLLKLKAAGKSEAELRTLTTLEKSSQVLMTVISDVLDYSRLEAGGVQIENRPFVPAEILTDVVSILTPAAKRNNLTLLATPRHAPELSWTADAARIRQVLLNLAGNAVKFTPAGCVELVSWVSPDSAAHSGRRLYFSVKDTGPGIPADRLEAIFEPFVQLETNPVLSQAGTGLGLSICRRLVQMMGGQITVHSTLGHGSTFEFWVPE